MVHVNTPKNLKCLSKHLSSIIEKVNFNQYSVADKNIQYYCSYLLNPGDTNKKWTWTTQPFIELIDFVCKNFIWLTQIAIQVNIEFQ